MYTNTELSGQMPLEFEPHLEELHAQSMESLDEFEQLLITENNRPRELFLSREPIKDDHDRSVSESRFEADTHDTLDTFVQIRKARNAPIHKGKSEARKRSVAESSKRKLIAKARVYGTRAESERKTLQSYLESSTRGSAEMIGGETEAEPILPLNKQPYDKGPFTLEDTLIRAARAFDSSHIRTRNDTHQDDLLEARFKMIDLESETVNSLDEEFINHLAILAVFNAKNREDFWAERAIQIDHYKTPKVHEHDIESAAANSAMREHADVLDQIL